MSLTFIDNFSSFAMGEPFCAHELQILGPIWQRRWISLSHSNLWGYVNNNFWGLTSQYWGIFKRDTIVEGSGNFDYPVFFKGTMTLKFHCLDRLRHLSLWTCTYHLPNLSRQYTWEGNLNENWSSRAQSSTLRHTSRHRQYHRWTKGTLSFRDVAASLQL